MDHDTGGEPAVQRRGGVVGTVTAGVSYVLFLVGVAALVSFFAPFVGLADLAWHTGVLPTVAAPTESDRIVDVAPLILGVVAASVAVWLR